MGIPTCAPQRRRNTGDLHDGDDVHTAWKSTVSAATATAQRACSRSGALRGSTDANPERQLPRGILVDPGAVGSTVRSGGTADRACAARTEGASRSGG